MVYCGLIMFRCEFINCVYGCGVEMYLSGGFCRVDIFCKNIVVQSKFSIYINLLLHVFNEGLIVVMSAKSIWGDGWSCF